MLLSRKTAAAALSASLAAVVVEEMSTSLQHNSFPQPRGESITAPLTREQPQLRAPQSTPVVVQNPVEISTGEVVAALGIITMLVLMARVEKKGGAQSYQPSISNSPTEPSWLGMRAFQALALRLHDTFTTRPRPEIDDIELETFQRFALELDHFNELNSKISGLCSPYSSVERSGRAARHSELPYHLAFLKGWGDFLEERGFTLRFEFEEVSDSTLGSVVLNARFSLEIGELRRAAVALEKLLPACYVERVPAKLANLLRHIEGSCESFASRRYERDSFWGRRNWLKEIELLRHGLQNLGRHVSASELQFLQDLLTQSPQLFSNFTSLVQLTRNQTPVDTHFWVDPTSLSSAFGLTEQSIIHSSRRHPVVNFTIQRMLHSLHDCLDFLSLELENQLDVSTPQPESEGGAAIAESEAKSPRKGYTPDILKQYYEELRNLQRKDDIFAGRIDGPHISRQILPQQRPEDAA